MPTALGRMHALRVLLASTAARVEALRAPCASWASSKRRLLLVHRAQSVQPVSMPTTLGSISVLYALLVSSAMLVAPPVQHADQAGSKR